MGVPHLLRIILESLPCPCARRSLALGAILTPLAISFLGQSACLAAEDESGSSDESLQVHGVFNAVLPGTETKSSLKLIVHPHLGDITKLDYIRNDLGLSYGITSRWDVRAKTRAYFGHGLKRIGFFEKAGFGDYKIETKVRLGQPLFRGWDTAVNLGYIRPIGSPPRDVTDGLIHSELSLSLAHRLESRPNTRVFFGLTSDFVEKTDVDGRIRKNEFDRSSQSFTFGFVIDQPRVHYTFETSFATTRIWGDSHEDRIMIRPGVVYQVSDHLTGGSRGEWWLGAAPSITYGPDGTDLGLSVKLRLKFDFKRLIGRKRE